MKRVYGIALGAVLFLWPSLPISASPVCGDRDKVLAALAADYAEQPVAVGVEANGGVIEVLEAPDGSTWTIILTYPKGPTCLMASGDSWQNLVAKPQGPGV